MGVQQPTRLPESTITSRGQTTLPKQVRDALELEPGDKVRYFIFDGEVRIAPVRPIERLFGILKHDGPPATLEDMDRAIAEGACRRVLGDDWSPERLEDADRMAAEASGRK